MAPPRASRRVVLPLDEDQGDLGPGEQSDNPSDDEQRVKPQTRASGRLVPVRSGTTLQQPVPATRGESPQTSPVKRERPKAKGKATKRERTHAATKPIFSFFNAATQRQRASPDTASPEPLGTLQDDLEPIHDDDIANDPGVTLSKASKTALAVRKRKAQHTGSFEDGTADGLPPAAAQKFRKTSDAERTPFSAVIDEDKRPWVEQFAPLNLAELSVHKQKVANVLHWLEGTFSGKCRKVLVLKGAAGTGKTATLRLLAQEMGFSISEWRNPAGYEHFGEGSSTTSTHFEEFVRRAGISDGLILSTDELHVSAISDTAKQRAPELRSHGKQVLLIEEFPNTFSRTSTVLQSFRSTILRYVSTAQVRDQVPVPVVLIVSETLLSTNTAAADSFTAHRLLGPELAAHPCVHTIEFNPIAPTMLTKALETVVVKEARKSGRRKTPGPRVLKHLAETGDIRSAVSSLEFFCLCGHEGDVWSGKVAFTKPKKARTEPSLTKAEEDTLKLIRNRESTLGIFHSVGKVVYNKRIDSAADGSLAHPPTWLPQHQRTKVPETDVNQLFDALGTDTPTYLAALHENYALSCSYSSTEGTLDSLCGCSEYISDADLLSVDRFSFGPRAFAGSAMDGLRQDEMSFQVAVRGLLFSLPSPVHRSMPAGGKRGDAQRMFFPTSLKLWKQREEIDGILDLLRDRIQNGTFDHPAAPYRDRSTLPSGVEAWKSTNALGEGDGLRSDAGVDARVQTSVMAKSELLLDRLPYLGHILSARKEVRTSTTLDQVLSVAQAHGQTSGMATDDEAVAAEDGDVAMSEQWATDRPDVDGQQIAKRPGRRGQAKAQLETEGEGLGIPVERHVERLVLADDDIVDD